MGCAHRSVDVDAATTRLKLLPPQGDSAFLVNRQVGLPDRMVALSCVPSNDIDAAITAASAIEQT